MKIYVTITYIVCFFIITSCDQQESAHKIFEREKELMEFLSLYKVPTNKSIVVLMPPTKCSSCKMGALEVLDTLENTFILARDSNIFFEKISSQKCVYYDEEIMMKKGLVKLYSAIIYIEKERVVKYIPLMN